MSRLVKSILKVLEVALIFMMSALVLVVLWGVFGRFILNASPRWTEEVATYLLVWLCLLGAVVAFARNEHLGVDLLISRFDLANRRLCELVVQCLVILFCAIVLIYGGSILVTETLGSGQVTPAMGVKMGLVYLVVPLSGVLFVIIAVERSLTIRKGQEVARDAAGEGGEV